MKKIIQGILRQSLEIADELITYDQNLGEHRLIDPHTGAEVSHHYGVTHIAAALIIYGTKEQDQSRMNIGISLLTTFLNNHYQLENISGYHADFNNFALTISWVYLKDRHIDISESIKKCVLSARDSSHNTINWLPMRLYVNNYRYLWSGEKKYLSVARRLVQKISIAKSDGFIIEDLLPHGVSFNMQYHVSTMALERLIDSNKDFKGLHGKLFNPESLGYIECLISPDGDINYQGRGTNQLFAWGPWVYLISTSNRLSLSNNHRSIEYLERKIIPALHNRNLLLNNANGELKSWWYDYHYFSVYLSHFVFWLSLGYTESSKPLDLGQHKPLGPNVDFSTIENDHWKIRQFQGRRKYLSEKGPSTVLVYGKSLGIVHKGSLGPWSNAFGKISDDVIPVILYHFGFLKVHQYPKYSMLNRFLEKINKFRESYGVRIEPLFGDIRLKGKIILFRIDSNEDLILNIPVQSSTSKKITCQLWIDSKRSRITQKMTTMSPYGLVEIWQSERSRGEVWELLIELKDE